LYGHKSVLSRGCHRRSFHRTEKPAKRSKFVDDSKNLKEIAEDNLKTLPPKK